jgi:hypothetical protein
VRLDFSAALKGQCGHSKPWFISSVCSDVSVEVALPSRFIATFGAAVRGHHSVDLRNGYLFQAGTVGAPVPGYASRDQSRSEQDLKTDRVGALAWGPHTIDHVT